MRKRRSVHEVARSLKDADRDPARGPTVGDVQTEGRAHEPPSAPREDLLDAAGLVLLLRSGAQGENPPIAAAEELAPPT